MKTLSLKIIVLTIFLLSFSAFPQHSLSVKSKCDSLKNLFEEKLDEWIEVDRNIRSKSITINEYHSLSNIFSGLWHETINLQLNSIECRYPEMKTDMKYVALDPIIPNYWKDIKSNKNLSQTETREKICSGLKAAYLSMEVDARNRLLKAEVDKTISREENLEINRIKYRGNLLRTEYYSALNCLHKANFNNEIKFELDIVKYPEVKIESWSVDATAEQINELEFLVKEYLEKNYPPLPLKMGMSGAINIFFTLTKENKIIELGIINEDPKDLGFTEITFSALAKISENQLLKSKNTSNAYLTLIVDFLTPQPTVKDDKSDLIIHTVLESSPELKQRSKDKILEFLNIEYSGKGDRSAGEVTVKFVCTKEGTAQNVTINKEKPVDMGFGKAVIEAMKYAEFTPAKEKSGEVVPIRMSLHFYFYNRKENRIEIK